MIHRIEKKEEDFLSVFSIFQYYAYKLILDSLNHPWGPMATHGDPWEPMRTYGDLWGPMGTPWEPMGTHGNPWGTMGAHGEPTGSPFKLNVRNLT